MNLKIFPSITIRRLPATVPHWTSLSRRGRRSGGKVGGVVGGVGGGGEVEVGGWGQGPQSYLRHSLGPQCGAGELAGVVPERFGRELERARDFVPDEPFGQVRPQVVDRDRRAV